MKKKQKRLTKKERKAQQGSAEDTRHIHCIACGRHLHSHEFSKSPITARYLSCLHGTKYAVCAKCVPAGQRLLEEHDRTGGPVRTAAAWH
jgi:hypothetical protein